MKLFLMCLFILGSFSSFASIDLDQMQSANCEEVIQITKKLNDLQSNILERYSRKNGDSLIFFTKVAWRIKESSQNYYMYFSKDEAELVDREVTDALAYTGTMYDAVKRFREMSKEVNILLQKKCLNN